MYELFEQKFREYEKSLFLVALSYLHNTKELTDTLNVFHDMPTEETEIMDCILRLDKKLAVYITLRFYNEMTYSEVAKVLNKPISTVKYKIKKALCELEKILKGDTNNA